MSSKGIPPWHMWGTTAEIVLQTNNLVTTQQLARIAYKRPETWSFVFAVALPNVVTGWSPGVPLVCSFDLIIGIGRSQITLPGFVQLIVTNIPTTGGQAPLVWSSVALTNGLFVPGTVVQTPEIISEICAQDIQVQGNIQLPVGGTQGTVASMTAMFAPKTHFRPDWHLPKHVADRGNNDPFTGGEIGGS